MKENNKKSGKEQESFFVSMLSKYLTYWPLFLVFILIGVASVFAYLKYTRPQYEATASMIIKDEKKGNDDSRIMESLNILSTKKIIENETDILQSRPVIEKVVKKLHLYAPVYSDNKFNSIALYRESPFFIEYTDMDSIVATRKKIIFTYDANSGFVLLNKRLYCAVNEYVYTPYGKIKFIPNKNYYQALSGLTFYFSTSTLGDAIEHIQDHLKVTATNKLSSIINLRYKEDEPELAEDILDEIIVSYTNANTAEKKALAKNTLTFIEARLGIVGAELDLIERKIQQYKANSGAVDISTQGQLFLQNVSLNDQKISEVNTQLLVIDQLEKLVSENDNNIAGMLPASLGVNDPALTQLMNNLNSSELERERLKKTVAENNPLLVSITDQIAQIKYRIKDQIQNQRNTLESNKANIAATNNNYNSMLHSIPVKERELLEISRDQNIKSTIYSFLLQKREESELSYASTLSDSKVVNFALSSDVPVSPNKLMVLGLAFLAVFGLPLTLINAREALNPNVLYRQEIEMNTSIPIIGEVAYNKTGKKLVIEPGKRSFIAEEFRKIRNSLLFMGVNGSHKKILVTSAISGEGKSFVAANLAISFALSGKKTVLVDMDLHNSSLCKIFDKEQQAGVSNYLSGEMELKDLICEVPLYENLYFLASGSLRDTPSELMENGRAQELISYLGDNFDTAIIDSEPIELVADARLLSSSCDATLYVVRHMYSPKRLLKRFDESNQMGPLNNPGIIFNGVKTRGFIKDNYGYNYGYGYMYGEQELNRREKKRLKSQAG